MYNILKFHRNNYYSFEFYCVVLKLIYLNDFKLIIRFRNFDINVYFKNNN